MKKVDKKLPNTSELVKKPDYITKFTEIENKVPDISNLATKAVLTQKLQILKRRYQILVNLFILRNSTD